MNSDFILFQVNPKLSVEIDVKSIETDCIEWFRRLRPAFIKRVESYRRKKSVQYLFTVASVSSQHH